MTWEEYRAYPLSPTYILAHPIIIITAIFTLSSQLTLSFSPLHRLRLRGRSSPAPAHPDFPHPLLPPLPSTSP